MESQTNAPDGGKTPDPNKPAAGVPEAYTFKLPDGQKLDEAAVAAATPVFRELGITQPQAEKLMEVYNKLTGDRVKSNTDAVMQMREGWRAEVAADKEIGGKLDAVKAEVGKALTQLKPDTVAAFKQAMDITGAGDHPGFIKAFYDLAKLVNEGTYVSPGGPSRHGQVAPGAPTKPSLAASMYPHLPH